MATAFDLGIFDSEVFKTRFEFPAWSRKVSKCKQIKKNITKH